MFVRMVKSAVLAAALLGLSSAASAATIFNFSFTAPWVLGGVGSGSGTLTADLQGDGSYQVTGVTGTAKVTAASATLPLNTVSSALLTPPTITGDATNGYYFAGILSGGGTSYNFSKNLFDNNYTISSGLRTTGGASFSLTAVPVSAPVPEAATWVMMILGFGMIGVMLRSGKRMGGVQNGHIKAI